jgi:hypothetical protein
LLPVSCSTGALATQEQTRNRGDLYFRLSIGDLQIKRCIGVLTQPGSDEITDRARPAVRLFLQLEAAALRG